MSKVGWKWEDLIVCGYYTPGPYAKEAERLIASLEAFDIPYDLTCANDLANQPWLSVTRAKPQKVKEALMKYTTRPILWLDADAIVKRDPRLTLPNSWIGDHIPAMSVHLFGGVRACSGTMIFRPSVASLECIDWWVDHLKENEECRLEDVMGLMPGLDRSLSCEWCWIFDLSTKRYGQCDVIIEHLQASREYRGDRPGGGPSPLLPSRLKRLAHEREADKPEQKGIFGQ